MYDTRKTYLRIFSALALAAALAAPLRAADPAADAGKAQDSAVAGPVQDENGVWRFPTSYVLSHVTDIAGVRPQLQPLLLRR